MNGVIQPGHLYEELEDTRQPREVVAREGSELASVLRARGWRVRSGWRSQSDSGDAIWLLRFEAHEACEA